MRLTIGLSIAAIFLVSSCGIKKELAEKTATNIELVKENTELKSELAGMKEQVKYLSTQLEIATGNQVVDGVERFDLTPSQIIVNAAEIMPQLAGEFTLSQVIEETLNREGSVAEPGTVYTEMVVLEDGTLTSFAPVGKSTINQQAQAVKLLKATSPWIPGEVSGERVKVRMVVPITFK
jgi:predicted nuclease with TOPRIM domain